MCSLKLETHTGCAPCELSLNLFFRLIWLLPYLDRAGNLLYHQEEYVQWNDSTFSHNSRAAWASHQWHCDEKWVWRGSDSSLLSLWIYSPPFKPGGLPKVAWALMVRLSLTSTFPQLRYFWEARESPMGLECHRAVTLGWGVCVPCNVGGSSGVKAHALVSASLSPVSEQKH